MQLKVALGSMNILAQSAHQGYLESIGITITDFQKLTSNVPWHGSDRARVSQTFKSLLYTTMDSLGVPRFQVPVEWIAANIAVFVAPINIQVACRFFEVSQTAEAMGRGVDEVDSCSSKQLFALVQQLLSAPESSSARALFEKNVGVKLARIQTPLRPKEGGEKHEGNSKIKRKT